MLYTFVRPLGLTDLQYTLNLNALNGRCVCRHRMDLDGGGGGSGHSRVAPGGRASSQGFESRLHIPLGHRSKALYSSSQQSLPANMTKKYVKGR